MKDQAIQAKADRQSNPGDSQQAAGPEGASAAPPGYGIDFLDRSPQPNRTGLSDRLKAGVESLSGLPMDDVRVHYNSDKPAQLQALAYTQGNEIHVGPGQEKHLPHEAWHVVQQKQGRVAATTQLKGGVPANADQGLEHEADAMGGLLDLMPSQRAPKGIEIQRPYAAAIHPAAATRRPTQALSFAAPVQRKLTRFGDIAKNNTGNVWQPHYTRQGIANVTPPTTLGTQADYGLGAAIEGKMPAPDQWITKISYNPKLDQAAGEATQVKAKLGPKHPPGTPITGWLRLTTLDQKTSTLNKGNAVTPYVGVLLVPDALGGEADLKNAVALPKGAADNLKAFVHNKLDLLVNHAAAWIYFEATVTHDDDIAAKERYAKQIDCIWFEYDANGQEVSGSRGEATIHAESPSQLVGGTPTPDATGKNLPDNFGNEQNRVFESTKGFAPKPTTAVSWRSEVTFGPTSTDGDGTWMVAKKLGPDHKIGTEPESKNDPIWSQRRKALEVATGNSEGYVAGHLLNHHLGGPGNDARNLAPIPDTGNKKHQSEVENTIKDLVNVDKAWVYYHVDVKFAYDATSLLNYPSAFECLWYQLDANGQEVAQTRGHKTITFESPSKIKAIKSTQNPKATAKPKAKKAKGTNNSTTNTAVVSSVTPIATPNIGGKSATTAFTKVAFNELVLDDPETLKPILKYQESLIVVLNLMELNPFFQDHKVEIKRDMGEILAQHKPVQAEALAYAEIDRIANVLGTFGNQLKDVQQLNPTLIQELTSALDTAEFERTKRDVALRNDAKIHLLDKYNDSRALSLFKLVENALDQYISELKTYEKLARNLLSIAKGAVNIGTNQQTQMLEALNELRKWQGKDPVTVDDIPTEFGKEIVEETGNIIHQNSEYFTAPWSPLSWVEFATEQTGIKPSNEKEAQKAVSETFTKKKAKIELPALDAKYELDVKLCDLIEKNASQWPDWIGQQNPVASAVQPFVFIIAKGGFNKEVVLNYLKPIYKLHTVAFKEYYEWITTFLPH